MRHFETIDILLTFALHAAMVTTCMMRRSRGGFPLTAVIGTWLMLIVSTLGLAQWVIGEARFQQILDSISQSLGLESSSDALGGSIVIGFHNALAFISGLGFFLLALGIYLLARLRIRESSEQVLSPPSSP